MGKKGNCQVTMLLSELSHNANYIHGNLADAIKDKIVHFALNTTVLIIEITKLLSS